MNIGSIDILIQAFSDVEETVDSAIASLSTLTGWQKGLFTIGRQRQQQELASQQFMEESTKQTIKYAASLETVAMSSKDLNKITDLMTTEFKRAIPVVEEGTESMGGLLGMTMKQTMGFLGLMFFTQRLAKSLSFLNQIIYEQFLAGEMMNLQWELFAAVLPVIEPFIEMIYNLFTIFYALPEPVKKFIGMAIVLGGLLVSIVSNVLQFVVMLGALSALGGAGAFAGIIGALSAIAVPLLWVIGIVAALYLAWKTNFLGMKDTVKNVFEGISRIFKGIGLIWKGIMEGNAKYVMAGVGKIAIGAVQVVVNAMGWLLKAATRTLLAFIWLPAQIAGFIGDAFDIKPLQKFAELANKPFEILDDAIDSGISTVNVWLDNLEEMIEDYASIEETTDKVTKSTSGFSDAIDGMTTSFNAQETATDNLDSSFDTMGEGFSSTIDDMISDTERFQTNFQKNVTDEIDKTSTFGGGGGISGAGGPSQMTSTTPKSVNDWLGYFKAFGKATGGTMMWDWYKKGSLPMSIYQQISKDPYWFQMGGVVPGLTGQAVPAILHGGEEVIPAGKSKGNVIYFNPTVNISAVVKGESDMRSISSGLMSDWKREIRRMV